VIPLQRLGSVVSDVVDSAEVTKVVEAEVIVVVVVVEVVVMVVVVDGEGDVGSAEVSVGGGVVLGKHWVRGGASAGPPTPSQVFENPSPYTWHSSVGPCHKK